MPADELPEAWPTERMVPTALIAAALTTERLNAGSAAWNSLMAYPDTVRSITYHDWFAIDQPP